MVEKNKYGIGESWAANDNRGIEYDDSHSKGSGTALMLLFAIIMGMVFYVGSFYLDREPLPEISKKQKQSESHFDLLPVPGFEENQC